MPRRKPDFKEHLHYFGNAKIIEPSDYKNNNTKVEIICDKGHTYKLSVNQIKNQGKDPNVCPHCKKQSNYYQSGIPESFIKKYALENDVDYEPKKKYYNRWNDTITFTSKKSGYTCEVKSLGHWEKTQPVFIHHYAPIKTEELERKFQTIRENYNDTNIVNLPISIFNKPPTPKVLQIIENSAWHIVEYNGTKEKSKFICTKCGYQKSTYVHNLNGKGSKCINCAKKQKKCIVTDKIIEICKESHLLLHDNFMYEDIDSNIDFTCNLCGNKFKKSWAEITGLYYKLKCPKCSSKNKAIKEKELYEFVSSIEPAIANDRNHISPLEIDCLLKNKKFAFEFCGNLWHSTKYNKDKNYHKNKMIACENKGTQLFTIFEDEWDGKKDICKSRIKNILGKTSNRLYARNCIVKESPKTEAKEFLDRTHIQGRCNFDIALSLYNNDKQISVMCFRKCHNRKYDWELVRFSSNLDTIVVGGASKLLKSFCKNHNGTIVSFADMRWSTGKVYEAIGFILDGIIPPRFSYVGSKTNWKRKHRFTYNKKRLVKIFDESSEDTEVTISEKNGLYRLYDCGYKRYILNIGELPTS